MESWRLELYHHGIKNQEWGVRHGPPYPLDRETSARVKSGDTPSAKKSSGVMSRSLSSLDKDTITKGQSMDYSTTPTKEVDSLIEEVEKRYFSDGSSEWFAPAKVISEFAKIGQNPYPDSGSPENPYFGYKYEDMNPGYGKEPGTTNNCALCGAALEIASRGYDIVAGRSHGGWSAGCFRRWFKGADNIRCDDWQDMENTIKSCGEGSSGVLAGYFGDGLGSGQGGHTLHWRITGGDIIVEDAQSGKYQKHVSSMSEVVSDYSFNSGACICTRLDDCEPDWEAMASDGVIGIKDKWMSGGSERAWRRRDTGKIHTRF